MRRKRHAYVRLTPIPDIRLVLGLLKNHYGSRSFTPHHDPVSELVLTILSQNTSDANSRPTFKNLRAIYPTYEDVLKAPPERIEEAIKDGGLGKIKAQRIQAALSEIKRQRGELNLDFLDDMPVQQGLDWLLGLPGVGYKTANCVLLFAFGKPALPVDTHIFRVSKRLGLIKLRAAPIEAHKVLIKIVPSENIYEYHVLMIEHGRQTCVARTPKCSQCVLVDLCPTGQNSRLVRSNIRGDDYA